MANVWDILAEGSIAAVGFSIDGQPFVIPMLYGSDRELIYLHGSAASRLMRQLETGLAACLTVTLIDGIVMALGFQPLHELSFGRGVWHGEEDYGCSTETRLAPQQT